jgi:hypothetical protein
MDLLNTLEQNFNTRRVTISEFAESSKYCGRKLYPRQKLLLKLIFLEELTDEEERILDYWLAGGRGGNEVEICSAIREKRAWLQENGYKHFREVVLVGGRRCSKGFITGLSMAKKMYDTLQLQDPGHHYGIDKDKEIVYSCIAASQQQAQEMQYADFSAMVNSCQAMQRYIHKVQELEFSVATESDLRKIESWKRQGRRVQRDISKLRGKALPANARTIRGSATMVYTFDEFAFFQQGESAQSDVEVYSAAVPSLAQFGRDAMIFCNSSPYSKVGKFYERFEVGMESGANNDDGETPGGANAILSLRFPSWALFDGWWEDPAYIGPKKCITVSPDWTWDRKKVDEDGDETDEYYYTQEDRQAIIIAQQEEREDPQKYKVERRGNFAEVVDAYLVPEMIDRMFRGRPVIDEGMVVQFEPLITNWGEQVHFGNTYRAHLDPSSTTAGFGFALGHSEYFENQNGQHEPHVVFDIVRRWEPKTFEDNVIDWEPILQELIYYCQVFRPATLTFDQHQSAWPIQWLKKELRQRGLNETRVFEKVATSQGNWDRAEVFRTCLYQGLIHAPSDTTDTAWATLELKYLQEIKTSRIPRVEKQDEGPVQTKDMADCMMEVVEAFLGNTVASEEREMLGAMPIVGGAMGGYPLGGGGGSGQPSSARQQMNRLYNTARAGEQSHHPGKGGGVARNPARRPFGGRPQPRKLPGW